MPTPAWMGALLEDADPVTGDFQCYDYDAHVRLTSVWTPADHPAAGESPSISDECDSTPTATQAAAGGAALLGGPAAYWQFEEGAAASRTITTFDGLERPTKAAFSTYNEAKWSTVTAYDGMDVTTVTPPKGGQATRTRTDIDGNTVESTEKGDPNDPTAAGRKDLTTTSTYDVSDQLTKLVSPAGTWTYDHDLLGRVTTTHDPESGDTKVTYTADDQVATSLDARGRGTLTYYDALDRPTFRYAITSSDQSANDDQRLAAWSYDSLEKGQLNGTYRYIGGKGGQQIATKITSYSADDKPTGTTMAISNPTDDAGTQDPLPDLTKILPTSLTHAFAYNLDGTESSHTLPKVATSAAGTVLSGEALQESYDDLGNPTKVQGQTALVQGTDYDQLGRATEYTLGTGSNEAIWVDQAYEDGTNRLTRQLVTARTTGSSVSDHHYAYDDSGNLLEDADPVTGDYQCYTYDAHVRLTTVWTPADHPAAGQSPSISDECDTTPTATQAAAGGASLLGGPAAYWQGWSFDTDTGLRKTQTTISPSLTSAGAAAATTVSDSYTYPAQGQEHADFATSIKRDTTVAPADGSDPSQASQTLAYATDPIGDTTARPDPAARSGTGTSDGAGEQSLTWDAEGNLATLTRPAGADDGGNSGDEGGTTRYVYDPDGTLLLTDSPSKTVLYDGETQITYTKDGSKLSAERDYDTFARQIATRTGNGDFDISFLIPNGQGTASVALDGASLTPTRRWFTPYGEARGQDDTSGTGGGSGAWPNQRGFLADPSDADTGLTSVGMRMYDASTGRFISPDPLLDTGDSAQMLGYQYAEDNPVTFTDPTGAIAVNSSGDPIPEKYQSKVNHAPEYKAGLNTTATVAEYHQSGGRSRYYHSSWYYPHSTWRHTRNSYTTDWSGSGYPSHTAQAKHASKANPGRGIKRKTAKQHPSFWHSVGHKLGGVADGAKSGLRTTGRFLDKHKKAITKGAAIGLFAGCLVISAGACAVAGVVVGAGTAYLNHKNNGGWGVDSWGDTAKDAGWAAAVSVAGGAAGKGLSSAVNRSLAAAGKPALTRFDPLSIKMNLDLNMLGLTTGACGRDLFRSCSY